LFQWISQLPEPIKKVIVVALLIVAAIGPIILILGTLTSAIGALITNIPLIISAFTSAAGAIAALGPAILPVIAIIAAVAATFYAAMKAGDYLSEHTPEIISAIENFESSVSSAYSSVISKSKQVVHNFKDFVQNVINAFRELPSRIVESLYRTAAEIKMAFKQMIENAKQSGRDFIQGFADGVKERVDKIIEAVKNVAEIIDEYLGFSCPDKGPLSKYETWMPDFMQGLASGIKDNMYMVKGAMNDVAKTMALPLSSNASMNMAINGTDSGYANATFGNTVMNINVDHISELNDLLRIQNQAQQRYRMGAY
jgi:phage-related protein